MKRNIPAKAIATYEKGKELHSRCYPFGLSNSYEECVAIFTHALELTEECEDAAPQREIAWALRDAQADVAYYLEENYPEAARKYEDAALLASELAENTDSSEDRDFWLCYTRYGQAVATESRGFAAIKEKRFPEGMGFLLQALLTYASGASAVPECEKPYYLHSAVGLIGEILKTVGVSLEEHMPDLARKAFECCLPFYEEALLHNPLWAHAGVSDNHGRWTEQIRKKIKTLKGEGEKNAG